MDKQKNCLRGKMSCTSIIIEHLGWGLEKHKAADIDAVWDDQRSTCQTNIDTVLFSCIFFGGFFFLPPLALAHILFVVRPPLSYHIQPPSLLISKLCHINLLVPLGFLSLLTNLKEKKWRVSISFPISKIPMTQHKHTQLANQNKLLPSPLYI